MCRTKESLERIAYEFCEDGAKHNVVYAEYRFNPYSDVEGVCGAEEYCEGVFAGLTRGQRDFNIKVRCILCFLRERPGEQVDQPFCQGCPQVSTQGISELSRHSFGHKVLCLSTRGLVACGFQVLVTSD